MTKIGRRRTKEPRRSPRARRPSAAPWRSDLIRTKRGLVSCPANVILILANDPAWVGVVGRNEFTAFDVVLLQQPPWASHYGPEQKPRIGDLWGDADDARTTVWLAANYSLRVSSAVVAEAVRAVAERASFHSVRRYFDGLAWDGTPRLANWPVTYLGADPSSHHIAAGRWWLISAVARVYQPGAKADHMIVLEGPQGSRKSTAVRVLAGTDWFTDELGDLGAKDTALQLQGRLIVELSELDSLTRSEVSRSKAFISRSVDRFRPPYGRRVVSVPRQCVFCGTTNTYDYLKDETGGRRFWPVRCGRIDLPGLERDRDQLWAEAVVEYRDGKEWWPSTTDEHEAFASAQEERRQPDPWEEPIAEWVSKLGSSTVTTGEVLLRCLGKDLEKQEKRDEMRVAACLKLLGFDRAKQEDGANGRVVRCWKRRTT